MNPLVELSRHLADATEIGGKALVAVNGRPHVPSSGVLWRQGVVVTTDHTLKRDEDVTITMPDGRNVSATVAGRDAGTDLAVLRAEGANDTAGAKFAEAASVQAGTLVLALGRRVENGISASMGIVSAISGPWRTWRGGHIDQFIRPDTNIYTGFSGGALVNAEGQVIGVNTSGLTRGVGVTVPTATVDRVVNDLLAQGRVRRGYLGVGLHPVRLPEGKTGLIVLSLEPDGPAAKSGLMLGDVVVSLGGKAVEDTDEVQAHLGPESVGQPLTAAVVRGGQATQLRLIPGERPAGER